MYDLVCKTKCTPDCMTILQHNRLWLQVFHGTKPVSCANSIARTGPDFSKIGAANGHRIGRGFYSTRQVKKARAYATEQGAICICRVLQGIRKVKMLDTNETAGSLLENGYHSVHEEGTDFIVLFHPDAVRVTHIVHLGPDDGMQQHLELEREALTKKHQADELQRTMQLQVRQ